MPPYDYQHHYYHQPGSLSSYPIIEPLSTNKMYFESYRSSLNTTQNFNPNFYRRHTESTLPTTSTPTYLSSTNYTNPNSFNYSHTTPHHHHHHPSGFFFGWNNGPSLLRTHSATYQEYPGSNPFTINPGTSSTNDKTIPTTQMTSVNNNYSHLFNVVPPLNFTIPTTTPLAPPSHRNRPLKRSLPSTTSSSSNIAKRQRLTGHLRTEIMKIKASKPSAFAWEIQQTLLQNGICTAQSLPSATTIQRVLNEPFKPPPPPVIAPIIETDIKPDIDRLMHLFNSPSSTRSFVPSPTLSSVDSTSECSICLEPYRSGQEVCILACSHEYHSPCIGGWMAKNRSCPMCRKDIHNQPQFVTILI